MDPEYATPSVGEIEEAKRYPNGSVCRISPLLDPDGAIPPEAIIGAWKVGAEGVIVGKFIQNPNYNPKLWPPRAHGRS